jgi:hypothetical protein
MANPLRLLAEGALSLVGIRVLEEPPFTLVERLAPDLEVRAYAPRLAAETVVEGAAGWEARREGFRRLARYIFGANRGGTGIAMTAPVAARDMAAMEGSRIAMTIPVAAAGGEAQALVMRFFLPQALLPDLAPAPNDPRVRLVTHPGQQLAALRWAGAIGPGAARAMEQQLIARLAPTRWQAAAAPETWFYDPPSTPFFLRRNEAVVPVIARG